MARTSSSSVVSPGAVLFGAIVGAFSTILLAVGTYTFDFELTGQLIGSYIGVGLVVAVAASVWISRTS